LGREIPYGGTLDAPQRRNRKFMSTSRKDIFPVEFLAALRMPQRHSARENARLGIWRAGLTQILCLRVHNTQSTLSTATAASMFDIAPDWRFASAPQLACAAPGKASSRRALNLDCTIAIRKSDANRR
jgi:hypothetical protein